jgi:hypothetical protein
MLPLALATPLKEQIALAHALVSADRASNRPGVVLPGISNLRVTRMNCDDRERHLLRRARSLVA